MAKTEEDIKWEYAQGIRKNDSQKIEYYCIMYAETDGIPVWESKQRFETEKQAIAHAQAEVKDGELSRRFSILEAKYRISVIACEVFPDKSITSISEIPLALHIISLL